MFGILIGILIRYCDCATACFPSLPKEAKKADEGELASSLESVELRVSLENIDEKTVNNEETLVQRYITNMQIETFLINNLSFNSDDKG